MTTTSLATSVQQYQRTYDKAIELYNLFEDADAPELLRLAKALADEAQILLNVAGLGWEHCGNLGRHLTFLHRYLKSNDKTSCAQDARDIVFFDLPAALRSIVARSSDDAHFDPRLRDAVVPLIQGGHLDSAVRKVFVVLTERLRRAFGVADQIDGDELVNLVFGEGAKIPVALDESQKQAMRNLISGFYGVYRNRYAHNDIQPDLPQTRAVLEMANTIILDIESLSSNSASKA